MTNVCISTRRGSAATAARLTAALEAAFGSGRVSCASDKHQPEDDAQALECGQRPADALLAVIGPDWLAAGESGRCRLDEPDDAVGAVLRSALASGKPVWPVLVDGAAMPAAADLPTALHGLTRKSPVALGGDTWDDDVARLIDTLRPRPLPQTVRQTAAWELTAAAGVLIATLLIADSWITHEVAQRREAQVSVAALAAGQVNGSAAPAPPQAAPARPSGAPAESLALAVAEPAPPYLVDDGAWSEVGQLQFVSRAELAAAGEPQAAARKPGKREKQQAIHLAREKADDGSTLPLDFVSWQNTP